MTKPDITYSSRGLFTTFYPETPAGESLWRNMYATGLERIFSDHSELFINQMRAAGYIVRKTTSSSISDENLLKQLEV